MNASARPEAWLAWSSGKDSAWALHCLRQAGQVNVVGLFSTIRRSDSRVGIHEVSRDVLEAQAAAAGLPLHTAELPWPCPNSDYLRITGALFERAKAQGVTHLAFGDLLLEDIRRWREQQLDESGLAPIFPLWQPDGGTQALAARMLDGGLQARIVAVDTRQADGQWLGRAFDSGLLPEMTHADRGVDVCGENGEFHTVCTAGPMFSRPVPVRLGEPQQQGTMRFRPAQLDR